MRRSRLAAKAKPARKPEGTIALINVVFLLLVFFLVAGSLSVPADQEIDPALAGSFDAARLSPGDIYIAADGAVRHAGRALPPAEAMTEAVAAREEAGEAVGAVTIVPDAALDAQTLLARLGELQSASPGGMRLLVERQTVGDGR